MRTVILGMGKMGTWLANEFAKEHVTSVFDKETTKMNDIKGINILSSLNEMKEFNPELLVNAVSLQNTIVAFKEVIPYLSNDCIISDIASIKADLVDFYKRTPFRFASLHPMFGPTFVNMKSIKEENAIIIKESDREAANLFRKFFEKRKVKIFEYTLEEHDRMMAYSLSIPFISSMVFAACVDSSTVPGTTFSKHMAIARGLLSEDSHLLAEILFNSYSLVELDKITGKLEYLKHIIKGRDYEEMGLFFQRLRENVK